MAQPKQKMMSTKTINLDVMGIKVSKLKCANCYKNFENSGKAVQALGKYWHVGCFKCVSCKVRIIGKYKPKGQGAECYECATGGDDIFDNFEEFLGDDVNKNVPGQKQLYHKCEICKKPIYENGCTDQNGKTYHQKCFCCDECGVSIAGKPYATDDKGKRICQKCMAKYQGKWIHCN